MKLWCSVCKSSFIWDDYKEICEECERDKTGIDWMHEEVRRVADELMQE